MPVIDLAGEATQKPSFDLERLLLWSIAAGLFIYAAVFSISYTADFHFGVNSVVLLTVTRCALLALCAAYLTCIARAVPAAMDTFSIIILMVSVTGAIVGLFSQWDWSTYFRQGFQYGFLFAFYVFGRSLGSAELPRKPLSLFCVTVLIAYSLAIAIYAMTPGLHSGSYSYQPNLALLPLSSAISSGQIASSLLAIAVIAVGNKRAVLLGACLIVAIVCARAIAKRQPQRGAIFRYALIAVLWPAITFSSSFVISTLSSIGLPLLTVGDRFTTNSTFTSFEPAPSAAAQNERLIARATKESRVDPVLRFTSGRNIEVAAIWRLLGSTSPLGIVAGAGLGAKYEMVYTSPATYEHVRFWRDQADLLPIHVAMTSGVPLALAMFGVFILMNLRMLSKLQKQEGTALVVLLYVLGSVPDTVLGFNPTNPIPWAALGFVSMRVLGPSPIFAR
jgi:hypothetical protein